MELKQLALVVAVAAACGGSRSIVDTRSDPGNGKIPVCVRKLLPSAQPCPTCTTNSPTVNAFPINGVAKDGEGGCDPEGVQILPRSLFSMKCGIGVDLGLDHGDLVSMRGGKPICSGEQLKGAMFFARSSTLAIEMFTIVDVRQLVVDASQAQSPPILGYKIVANDKATSMCDIDAANAARAILGLEPRATYKVPGVAEAVGPNQDLVIPIGGPLYSRDVRQIDDSGAFFNLACADDALAKRSLDGLYSGTDEKADLAALRMLTATYCHKPFTARGMSFKWKATEQTDSPEARWKGDVTNCFKSARLAHSTAKFDQLPDELLPEGCKAKPCKDWAAWQAAIVAECPKLADCPSQTNDFESFLDESKQEMKFNRKKRASSTAASN
ncbi:MAG: ADYC domain-containing protein [Kofleriaceae bacterium]